MYWRTKTDSGKLVVYTKVRFNFIKGIRQINLVTLGYEGPDMIINIG